MNIISYLKINFKICFHKFSNNGVNKVLNKTFVNELYEKVHYEKTSKVSFCHQTFVRKNNLGSAVH